MNTFNETQVAASGVFAKNAKFHTEELRYDKNVKFHSEELRYDTRTVVLISLHNFKRVKVVFKINKLAL